MKVYVVEPRELPVAGVFASPEAAIAAYPGEYEECNSDGKRWWHCWDPQMDITEYEVQS